MQLHPRIIKQVVTQVPKRKEAKRGYVSSAVLMLFFNRGDETYLVYIRRTKGMKLHSGHMAFPGGKIDPEDTSSFVTAARETFEEIGVKTDSYDYLGEMGFFETLTSNYDAAAHVAWSPREPVYSINPVEVAEIVEFPLRELQRQFQTDLDLSHDTDIYYLNFHYQPDHQETANLWGLTARITHHFLSGLNRCLQETS